MIVLGFILVVLGCVTAPPSTSDWVPPQHVANFDYLPPSQAAVQQSPAVFTVGKAAFKYLGKKAWLSAPQFANLEKAIAEDLPEILTAKGFGVRGPFDSYDLIPYADKKAIDFYLLPVVTPLVMLPEYAKSPIKVTVKIDLELREIFTREMMWSKNLTLAEFEVPFTSVLNNYTTKDGKVVDMAFRLEALENLMAIEMEKRYPVVMDTIYKLIDPEEMTIIREQAQEVKSKKGY
ncbi:MAG: hypothetical protein R6X10_09350 [Desulfobacterales bacterium]